MCVKPHLEAFVNYHFMRLFTSQEVKMCTPFWGDETLDGTELMWYVRLLLLVSQEDK